MAAWKTDHPSQDQFMDPTKVADCKVNVADCTTAICGNPLYKDYDTCKEIATKTKCDADVADCSYDFCLTTYGKTATHCKSAWKSANPSQKQFLNPATIAKCQTNADDCTKDICGNSVYTDSSTCKFFDEVQKCDKNV